MLRMESIGFVSKEKNVCRPRMLCNVQEKTCKQGTTHQANLTTTSLRQPVQTFLDQRCGEVERLKKKEAQTCQTQSIISQFDVWAQFSSCFYTIRQYYCKGLCAWHSQRVMVEEEYLLAHATLSADRDRWQVQSLSRCNCCMLHFAFSCCSRFVFALVHWCGAFVPNPHVGLLLNSSHGQSLYISHHFTTRLTQASRVYMFEFCTIQACSERNIADVAQDGRKSHHVSSVFFFSANSKLWAM